MVVRELLTKWGFYVDQSALDRMERRVKSVRKTVGVVGKAVRDAGSKVSLAVGAPVAAFTGFAVKASADFQKSMNMVGAVTKTTGTEAFERLQALAKEMGATTQFSAGEAAEAMKFLGMAGMDANRIMVALPKTLQLAAASQMDLASAADIVTNVMAGYQMKTGELAHANDVLVNAMTGANVDLRMLGESFKYAGPLAQSAGLTFAQSAAMIAKLGDAGIQGAMAGTALRGSLLRLQNPTKEAQKLMQGLGVAIEEFKRPDGSFDLIGAIRAFSESGATAAQIAEIVGDRAGPSLAFLTELGADAIEDFAAKLEESGSAARVAEAQMRGLPGAILLLKSAFEAVQLALTGGETGSAIEAFIRKVAELLQKLSQADPKLFRMVAIIGGIAVAVGPVLIALGMMASGISALMALVNPVTLAIGALILILITMADEAKAVFGDLGISWRDAFEGIGATFTWLEGAMGAVRSWSDRYLKPVFDWLAARLDDLEEKFPRLGKLVKFVLKQVWGLMRLKPFFAVWDRLIERIKRAFGPIQRLAGFLGLKAEEPPAEGEEGKAEAGEKPALRAAGAAEGIEAGIPLASPIPVPERLPGIPVPGATTTVAGGSNITVSPTINIEAPAGMSQEDREDLADTIAVKTRQELERTLRQTEASIPEAD